MKKYPQWGKSLLYSACPFIIGAIAFLSVAGHRVLNPKNIAWLGDGWDPWTQFIGWGFFRYSDWSFPIGLNPHYGLEISSAIIYSDSNPFLAFIFKPFSAWLPEPFQYFGILILLCFLLQAFFSWKILSLFTENLLVRILATAIFVFSPPMLWRLYEHLSLSGGHCLLLAALYLYFKPQLPHRRLAWIAVTGIAAMFHAYLLAMVAAIWLTDLVTERIKKTISTKTALLELALVTVSTGFFCWQVGYFATSGTSAPGFGRYSLNLLSIINSGSIMPFGKFVTNWSYLLKGISTASDGNYEGFNYLGLGVIFLWVCLFPPLLKQPRLITGTVKKYYPLFITAICLTLFALSNNVTFGPWRLFSYPLPELITRLAGIFRSSGRMFWPVFYLIVLASVYLTVRSFNKGVVIALLALALFLQIADTHKGWSGIRQRMMAEASPLMKNPLPFKDPFWDIAAQKYSKVRTVCYSPHSRPYTKAIAIHAEAHKMPTDAAYITRVNPTAIDVWRKKWAALSNGNPDGDSLYILASPCTPEAFLNLDTTTDLFAQIDTLYVVAPGWKKCVDCPPVQGEISNISALLPPIAFNKAIPITRAKDTGRPYLISGWYQAERDGTWSRGSESTVILPLSGSRPKKILLQANGLITKSHPEQRILIRVNNEHNAGFTFTSGKETAFEIDIPESVFQADSFDDTIRLDFSYPDAATPKEVGWKNDNRVYALFLRSITVE